MKALVAEMEMVSAQGLSFDTLYIGGGTPSVYEHHEIGQIVAAALHNFDLRPDSEITIEVNPGTASLEQFEGYRAAGINRTNIGVQSFNQRHLEFLGRLHTAAEARKALSDALQAGFAHTGLDLIYGLPNQSKTDWLADLKQAVAYDPTHLSCYMLTYEKRTPLYNDLKDGRVQSLVEDEVRKLFDTTIDYLEAHQYLQYEISNFARIGEDGKRYLSRHNLKYWKRMPYIGLGPSAHSFIESQRSWNFSRVDRYLAAIESGKTPIADREMLTAEQEMIEAIYLGLRMAQGIDLIGFRKKFEIDFSQAFKVVIADLANKNYLKVGTTHAALTRQGRAFLDSIASMFIARDVCDRQSKSK
jgi:oxygen-independent coproporphyrinogen-3 oxidase